MIPILVLILAILNPGFTPPPASCVLVDSGSSSVRLLNSSSTLENLLLLNSSKSRKKLPSSLKLLRHKYPKLSTLITKDFLSQLKNATGKQGIFVGDIHRGPARMPQVYSSKDYGASSHYRMKDQKSSKKSFYKYLIQKLLRRRPKSSHKSHSPTSSSSTKQKSSQQPMSTEVLYSPGWSGGGGWGWGWGKGHGGGGHGHGISLIDLVLCGLSLLSLGGFLLNLLLNLANLFGFGMMTTTATYPVTVTQTATATGTGTATGGTSTATTGGLVPGGAPGLSAVASGPGTGWGLTSRTLDSGWGWKGNIGHFKAHIQLPAATTTTTTTTLPPTETGTGTGGTGLTALALAPLGLRRRRPKREIFEPYVDPSTSLETLAKAILNTIGSARHKYECMEELFCENNKKARVIGQWLEYFMPMYSFTLSYIGYARGTHNSLSDHIRAIVLGASETNCHAHYPRCEATTRSEPDPSPEPEPAE